MTLHSVQETQDNVFSRNKHWMELRRNYIIDFDKVLKLSDIIIEESEREAAWYQFPELIIQGVKQTYYARYTNWVFKIQINL